MFVELQAFFTKKYGKKPEMDRQTTPKFSCTYDQRALGNKYVLLLCSNFPKPVRPIR